MASQTAKGSGSTVNNGATVANGGAVTGVTQSLDLNDINGAVGVSARYGSKIVAKDGTGGSTTNPDGIVTSKGTGTLAYFPAQADGNWIVMAAGNTAAAKINNTATTRLHIPAAEGEFGKLDVPQPHVADRKLGSAADVAYDTLAVPSTERVPGRTKGTGAGDALAFQDPAQAAGNATTVVLVSDTRAVPGELTYMFGGKAPKRDDYKSREVFES